MAALLETQALEYWVDRAGGRAGGGCGALRRLLSSGCSLGNEGSSGLGGSGGRAGARAGGGRSGGRIGFSIRPLVNVLLQRGLLNI